MSHSETLKQALTRVGDAEHVDLLSTETHDLTKRQVTEIINGQAGDHTPISTLKSLKRLGMQRIKEGKTVFPWGAMEDVHHSTDDDQMGGGVW